MTDELHIHSFADLKGDLTDKKLIVHSREVADWLTSHVSAMDAPMTTNDPQAEYGKPMLSGKRMKGYEGEATIMKLLNSIPMPNTEVRDFYEALISSGELIRRDELTKLLEACEAVRSVRAPVSDDDDGEWEMQPLLDALDKLDAALDHINAKNP